MSRRGIASRLYAQICDEAAQWFVEFSEGDVDAGGRAAFDAWLRQSPDHLRAYLMTSALWEEAEAVNRQHHPDTVALLARAAQENVVSWQAPAATLAALASRRGKRGAWLAVAAGAAFVAAGAGLWMWLQQQAQMYVTSAGEQRSIALSDGSTLQLNARSRARVSYDASGRRVELLDGQALFTVALDRARPFVVHSDGTRIQALGTRFDVYRQAAGVTVTVVEGRVAVSRSGPAPRAATAQPPASATVLSAGEQVVVRGSAVGAPGAANISAVTAWTERRLVFDNTPLETVVAEFNRYNTRPVFIDDESLRDFHVSGVFSSTDSAQLLQFLEQRFAVRVRRDGAGVHVSR